MSSCVLSLICAAEGYGMERLFFAMLALALQWFRLRYNARLQLMAAQIRILRSRIDASRIVPTPKEKAELLRLGAALEHDVADVLHVVRPETYRKWVRQFRRGIVFQPSGRPRTPTATVNLVLFSSSSVSNSNLCKVNIGSSSSSFVNCCQSDSSKSGMSVSGTGCSSNLKMRA